MTGKKQQLTGNSIVFDWGNTLVFDPFQKVLPQVCEQACTFARNTYNVSLDPTQVAKHWEKANAEINFPYASHFSQEEPFIQAALSACDVPADIRILLGPDILGLYRKAFKALLLKNARSDELQPTLQALRAKGKHLAVISNDRSFSPKATLTWLGLAEYFDHFLTSEEIGIEKPDPKVFGVASTYFKKPIEDIIYVGDDPIRDVTCAHKAGAKAILYVPPQKYQTKTKWRDYSVVEDAPDAQVSTFSELLEVIS